MVGLRTTDVDVGCECGEEKGFPDLASAKQWARKHFDTCKGLGPTIGATATIALLPVRGKKGTNAGESVPGLDFLLSAKKDKEAT